MKKAKQIEAPTRGKNYLAQIEEMKKKHPGMMILVRMGDFYELFGDDATNAAKILGLTITTRDGTLPMAGFPYHQLETYLRKLMASGQRVAIADPPK